VAELHQFWIAGLETLSHCFQGRHSLLDHPCGHLAGIVGLYYFPAITPTLWGSAVVVGEWHEGCVGVLAERLHPQSQPYYCCLCREEIENKTLLDYGVFGNRPEVRYIRPEHRGYELQIVSHYGCWYSRKRGWSPSQNPLHRLREAVRAEAG